MGLFLFSHSQAGLCLIFAQTFVSFLRRPFSREDPLFTRLVDSTTVQPLPTLLQHNNKKQLKFVSSSFFHNSIFMHKRHNCPFARQYDIAPSEDFWRLPTL